jgi:hypothetical protein
VMVNKGDYAFQELIKAAGWKGIQGVLSSDFNSDSLADLLIMCDSGLVSTLNDGKLNFIVTSKSRTPAVPYKMAIGDLDNDGDDDVAVISLSSDVVMILEQKELFTELTLGSTSYNFSAVKRDSSRATSVSIYNTGVLPLHIDSIYSSSPAFAVTPRSGELSPNDSLKLNVIFTPAEIRSYSDSITIISNDSLHARSKFYVSGRTTQTIIDSVYPGMNAPSADPACLVAHFSQNIDPASLTQSAIRVYGSKSGYHETSPVFTPTSRILTVTPAGRFIDGELVTVTILNTIRLANAAPVLSPYRWNFTARVHEGTGTFANGTIIPVGGYPRSLCSADLDNDGLEDIVVSNYLPNTLSIFKSNRNALPTAAATIEFGTSPFVIASGDLDHDGNIDLVVNTNNNLTILKNAGNFHFTTSTIAIDPGITYITMCDLDGDGDPDIVAANRVTNNVQIFRNDGGMRFTSVLLPFVISGSMVMEAGDFDNDGMADLLVAKDADNNFTLLHNEGGMVFVPMQLPNLAGYIRTMVLADFNGDGKLDIFSPNANMNSASVLLNKGNLTFENIRQEGVTHDALTFTGADYDNDGDIDIASANNGYSSFGSVYRNDSLRFRESTQFLIEPGTQASMSGDFNGDGAMDIAFAYEGLKSLRVFFGITKKNYTLSEPYVFFPNVQRGTSLKKNVIVWNKGTTVLQFDSLYVNSRYFTARINKVMLPPLDSAVIDVTFTPDSIGTFEAVVTIISEAVTPATIVLTGICVPATGVEKSDQLIPEEYALFQNYPNPFNPTTTMKFSVPVASDVTLKVYDVLGRDVATLVNDRLGAGYYSVAFNGANRSSGIYFYRIAAVSCDSDKKRVFNQVKSLLLMK